MDLTSVYVEVPGGYVAFVEELPGANTQGDTLDEARENLCEAVQLLLQVHRERAETLILNQRVVKERFASSTS